MGRIAIPTLFSAAIATTLWVFHAENTRAQSQILEKTAHSTRQQPQLANAEISQGLVGKINQIAQMFSPVTTERRSITVLGQGQVTAPADRARLEFSISIRDPAEALDSDVPQMLNPPVRSSLSADVLQPIVEALVAAKVPKDAIAVRMSGVENAEVIVELNKPTKPRVQEVVLAVSEAARNNGRLFLQSVGAEYSVNNCRPLENASRRAALNDAQTRLESLAAAVKVGLGEVLHITEFPVAGLPSAFSNCGTKVGAPADPLRASSGSTPPYDPAAPTEVQVRSQVSVTYAIE